MRRFKENLLVQFSVASFLIMAILAVVLSMILTSRLNRDMDLLRDHGAAMMSGTMIKPSDPYSIPSLTEDVRNLRWITYAAVGGGFIMLYAGLVTIVARGWRTITKQQSMLEAVNSELADRVEEVRASNEQLLVEVRERKRAEEDLERRNIELAAVNRELEAFSYSVYQDLRVPLRSIDRISHGLMEDYADEMGAEGAEDLQRVLVATRRMSGLVDDMLNMSRVLNLSTVSPTELRRERVDLSELAHKITAELPQQEPERQVEFTVADGLVARGDPHLLRVVLENLLGNAWKFTGKHPRARIEFGAAVHEGEQAYIVRDDGAGFDMAKADNLFGAFHRQHSEAEFEGIGIGLATVQRIIESHGGRIWAEGEVEKGAAFYFTLDGG